MCLKLVLAKSVPYETKDVKNDATNDFCCCDPTGCINHTSRRQCFASITRSLRDFEAGLDFQSTISSSKARLRRSDSFGKGTRRRKCTIGAIFETGSGPAAVLQAFVTPIAIRDWTTRGARATQECLAPENILGSRVVETIHTSDHWRSLGSDPVFGLQKRGKPL